MMGRKKGRAGKSAVDILEEATRLLRGDPLLLAPYYFGSLPFILGLLYFWSDMSAGANAWRHGPQAALGMTLLFIWMKTWQTIYTRSLLAGIRGEAAPRWSLRRVLRAAGIQTAVQPWGLLILPAAFIILLPFPQAFAFFQNVTLSGCGDEDDLRGILQKSWRQASLWPMQNALVIWLTSPFLLVFAAAFILVLVPVSASFNPEASFSSLVIIAALVVIPLCPLGVVTALNIGIAVLLVPWLLKTLLDVETIFSMSGAHILNTTFFAVVCSLGYLCLDPLVKASYCLRCFYGESLQTGDDLRVELRSPSRRGGILTLSLAVLLCLASVGGALAGTGEGAISRQGNPVSARKLDSAIESIIKYPEYAWRMPREKHEEGQEGRGAIYGFLESIVDILEDGWSLVRKGLVKVWDFIRGIFSRIIPSLPRLEKPDAGWTSFSRALIILPLIAVLTVAAFLAWRAWRARRSRRATTDVSVVPAPDITREDLEATALPEEGWLGLFKELMEKGELRMALRALHLATLASLAYQDLITIARYKSDREYELELRRRSHTRPRLAEAFAENRALFERVWYGSHEATPGSIESFVRNREKMRTDG
jgi:hypothetical protein